MIRIVTDSAADLTAAELNVPGIFVVPLSVTFADGTTQLDDGTMTKDEFFVRLAEDSKLPRTSQPSPASFMQVYEDAAAAGDEVLVITIGQKLSGTYQCAHLAAADVGLQVHIVDSEAASQAEALLVREAVRLRDEEGLTAEEIAAVLEQFKKRVRIVAVVDSLKHLQKGGRLPAAVAIVGGALGINGIGPFKGRCQQMALAAKHAQHTAHTGCTADRAVLQLNMSLAHAQSRADVDMPRQQLKLAVDGAAGYRRDRAIKRNAVRRHDFERESCHTSTALLLIGLG